MSTILLIFVRHWFFRTKFSTKFQRPIARLRRQRSSVRSVVLKFDFDLRRLQLRSWFILSPSRCFAQIGGPKKARKKIFFDRKRFSSSSVQLRLSFSQEGFDEERQKLSCFFLFRFVMFGTLQSGVSQRLQRQKTKPKKKKKRFKIFSNKLLQRNDVGSKFVHSVRTAAWDISKKTNRHFDFATVRSEGRNFRPRSGFAPAPISPRPRRTWLAVAWSMRCRGSPKNFPLCLCSCPSNIFTLRWFLALRFEPCKETH